MKDGKVIHLVDFIEKKQIIDPSNQVEIKEIKRSDNTLLFKRGIAFMVDILTIGLLKTAIDGAYGVFINQYFAPLNYAQKLELIQGNILTHGLIFLSLYTSYFFYTTFIFNGKTLGKKALGLTIISEKFYKNKKELDYSVNFKNAFNRAIGYLFCYLSFGTFFVFNFSSEDRRGLADFLSSSRTVSDDWLRQELDRRASVAEVAYINIASLPASEAA